MNSGRTIRLFLVDGSPTGIMTAEIMNWTGSVASAPRSKVDQLIKREEASRTGVYFLVGPDPDSPTDAMVYIGETDNVGKRLAQHSRDETKDFWNRVCIVTSKDQNLTKAHVRYLESRLIAIAQGAGRAKLTNGTAPDVPVLPEADISDMEFFIRQVTTVLPVVGHEFLKERPSAQPKAMMVDELMESDVSTIDVSPRFEINAVSVSASMHEIDGVFVVQKGSTARANGTKSWTNRTYRDKLIADGKLAPTDDEKVLQFVEDVEFDTPTAAAVAVVARHENGRMAWKIPGTSQTYADWQNAKLDAAMGQGD